MDNRRYKRIHIDAPIRIQGVDLQGNSFEEETLTVDISGTGAQFVSTHEYNREKIVVVNIHLAYPLGNVVKAGDWTCKARIARIDKIVKTEDGKLKKQNIAIQFMGMLGADNSNSKDPWKQIID